MRRLARSEYSRMSIKVIVEFDRADDACVDYCASGAVPTSVGISPGCREKHNLVLFSNDDQSYFGFEIQRVACACGKIGSRRLGTQWRKIRESKTYFGCGGARR
jgi:hypothetical protein